MKSEKTWKSGGGVFMMCLGVQSKNYLVRAEQKSDFTLSNRYSYTTASKVLPITMAVVSWSIQPQPNPTAMHPIAIGTTAGIRNRIPFLATLARGLKEIIQAFQMLPQPIRPRILLFGRLWVFVPFIPPTTRTVPEAKSNC